jgi:hypothetical protein
MKRFQSVPTSFRLFGPALAAVICVACGGQVQGGGNFSAAGSAGSGGAAQSAPGSGGAGAVGPSGGSGGGDSVSPVSGSAGSGSAPIGSAGAGPGACQLPWWGTSLAGVAGLTNCPGPYNPAMLAYSDTQYPSCWKLTGPLGTKHDGANLSCCYNFDETACGEGQGASESCIDVWYFGDGTGQTAIPTDSVTGQLTTCSIPFGTPITVDTQAERASHLIGAWVKCTADDPLDTPLRGDGIIFRADGTFHTLQIDSSGHLVETPGCNQFGLWGLIVRPDQPQIDMAIDAGWMIGLPYFTDNSPRQLKIDWEGNVDVYVAVH